MLGNPFSLATWTVSSFALGAGGSGYSVNDILTCAQPSLSPYIAATCAVSSINGSGAITGINTTPTNAGAYALPPLLQAQQWTPANGFSAFDKNGNFLTTGGTGTGATLTPVWAPDWSNGNSSYYMGSGGLIADTILQYIRVMQVPQATDATYGDMNALRLFGLNFDIDAVQVQGGQNGINFLFAADVRATRLNTVGAVNGLVISNASNIVADGSILAENLTNIVDNNDNPTAHLLEMIHGRGILWLR